MSDVGAIIADLVRAGVPAELVGRVAAALTERMPEVVVTKDDQAERRRAADRERKARVRGIPQIPQTSADSADKTGNSADSDAPRARVVNTPTFSDEKVLKEEKKDLPSVDPKKRERKIASRMPADWQPTEAERQFALDLGLTPAEVNIETEKIRDWSRSHPKGAKLDFGGFWRNWCRSFIERKGSGNGQYRPASGQFVAGGGSRPTGVAGVAAGLALFKASLDGGPREANNPRELDLEPYPTTGGRKAYR